MTEEALDVYSEDGTEQGRSLPRSEVHAQGLWHKYVPFSQWHSLSVWLVDSDGRLQCSQCVVSLTKRCLGLFILG